MKCPACDRNLTSLNAGSIEVDVCKNGCGGVWFDSNEIKAFDEPSEIDGEKILSVERDPKITIESDKKRVCPKCPAQPLVRQFFDTKGQVTIDQCWSCGGVWLDSGELKSIRAQFKTEAERQAAGDKYLDEIFRQEIVGMKREGAAEIAKYEAEHRNVFVSFATGLKSLLFPLD